VQLTETEELIQAKDQLDALLATRLQALDIADVTVGECGRTTRCWLVEDQRRSPTEAARMMGAARALPFYPDLAAAFTAGDISADHVRVILGCLRRLLPSQVEAMLPILVEAARSMDPVMLDLSWSGSCCCAPAPMTTGKPPNNGGTPTGGRASPPRSAGWSTSKGCSTPIPAAPCSPPSRR
jgi:hypothetical protein